MKYLIKWKGYSYNKDIQKLIINLENSKKLLKKY